MEKKSVEKDNFFTRYAPFLMLLCVLEVIMPLDYRLVQGATLKYCFFKTEAKKGNYIQFQKVMPISKTLYVIRPNKKEGNILEAAAAAIFLVIRRFKAIK